MRAECPECEATFRVPAPEDGRRIKCPECGVRFDPLKEEADDSYSVRKSGSTKKKKNFPVIEVVGGSIAAVVAIGILIFVIVTRPKAEPVKEVAKAGNRAENQPEFQPVASAPAVLPQIKSGPGSTPKTQGIFGLNTAQQPSDEETADADAKTSSDITTERTGTKPKSDLDQLFLRPVTNKPPKIRAGILKPDEDEPPLEVPSFYSLRMARQTAKTPPTVTKSSKLTLEEVKQATVYIKVEAGDLSGTGSGFLIWVQQGEGFIATNHHVIEAAMSSRTESGVAPSISVVFNSGLPGAEVELSAKILAFDPGADLAVLRVKMSGKVPKPIEPWAGPKPFETMDVQIFGFPFGGRLATNGKHPNISVNKGSVSSLRIDKAERLEQIQISGPLNPGNSGGPIVDKDGRLVGIAVATITGSGLGFAVPVHELVALLEGKLLATLFLPTGLESDKANFLVMIPVMDPLSHVKTVYVRYWTGAGAKPKAIKDPKIGYKPIERAEQVRLEVPDLPTSLSFALGDLKIPKDATEVVIQIASENDNKLVAASAPVTYKLKLTDLPTGSDAIPFSELTKNLSSQADRVVIVKGRILSAPASRADVQEMVVGDMDGKKANGIRFLASREVATQFDELDKEDLAKPARITCVIGKADGDGVVPVRVARVDFLARRDRIERSIPEEEESKDELAKLNRNPEKYSGLTMDILTDAVPSTSRVGANNELVVLFPNMKMPRNLAFETTPGLTARIQDEKFKVNGIYHTKLAVKVGKPNKPGAPVPIVVRKIEIIDRKDGKVLKTIE